MLGRIREHKERLLDLKEAQQPLLIDEQECDPLGVDMLLSDSSIARLNLG
jgi:hypothetical protein